MANAQYTVGNADVTGTAFAVPGDQPGTDQSFQVEPDNLSKGQQWYVHIENGFGVNVDVTVQGSHYADGAMSAPVDDGVAETVSAGTNAAFDGETGHSFLQVNVDPAADPTTGTLTVTFQVRDN